MIPKNQFLDAMIHVCSLARLHETVAATGARHVVTLLKDGPIWCSGPAASCRRTISFSGMDDITGPLEGYIAPADEHVTRLLDFVRGWDRRRPAGDTLLNAGISRSTAGAYVAACALNPHRDEATIARRRCAAPRRPPPPISASSRWPIARSGGTAA